MELNKEEREAIIDLIGVALELKKVSYKMINILQSAQYKMILENKIQEIQIGDEKHGTA